LIPRARISVERSVARRRSFGAPGVWLGLSIAPAIGDSMTAEERFIAAGR
jgi:hypothetical protein